MRVAVTGAATGIGAATAAKLKQAGAHVVAFDIAEPQLVDRWIAVDLADPASIRAAADAADGPFDALINVAGLPPREGLSAKVLAVNYLGLVAFTEAMLATLAPGAAIVNVASRAGAHWRDNIDEVRALMAVTDVAALPGFVAAHGIDHVRAYNLSKEAVIVWSMAQCESLIARDVRINTVSPAAVTTGILDDFTAAFGDRIAKNVARAGRPGTAEEIADVICFLAGPESGWLKGIDVTVDGGMTAMAQADMLGFADDRAAAP